MNYLQSVPYTPTVPALSPETPSVLYPQYYTCGPNGDNFYVWPAYTTEGLDINSPQSSSPDTEYVTTKTHAPVSADSSTPVRGIRRRITANKKERRRTVSLNHAFDELRNCIPNVPRDTKMSKIKSLRLATTYIAYLTNLLEEDKPGTFSADVTSDCSNKKITPPQLVNNFSERRKSNRTGWPEHVWALELKQDNSS